MAGLEPLSPNGVRTRVGLCLSELGLLDRDSCSGGKISAGWGAAFLSSEPDLPDTWEGMSRLHAECSESQISLIEDF